MKAHAVPNRVEARRTDHLDTGWRSCVCAVLCYCWLECEEKEIRLLQIRNKMQQVKVNHVNFSSTSPRLPGRRVPLELLAMSASWIVELTFLDLTAKNSVGVV